MTREEAILCLKGMKNYARDTFTEQTDWQASLDMAIKSLEQEPCEDATLKDIFCMGCEYKEQKPKTGHWIATDEGFSPYQCSECRSIEFKQSNYCPNCGAKMVESQKSEE